MARIGQKLSRFSSKVGKGLNHGFRIGQKLAPYASALLNQAGHPELASLAGQAGRLAGSYANTLEKSNNNAGRVARDAVRGLARQQLSTVA